MPFNPVARPIPSALNHSCGTWRVQVQLDSITSNELGDPSAIMTVPGRPHLDALQGWETNPNLGAPLRHESMHAVNGPECEYCESSKGVKWIYTGKTISRSWSKEICHAKR